jgi:hypothetical protein
MKVTEILVESRMGELHSEFADVYHKLAPKIQRHKDAASAEQLYQALKAVAVENNAVAIFKDMLNAARNAAHMDYDTNPGGFENWFWYLPFDDDLTEGSSDIRKKISKFEELALAANRAGDDEKCKFYQQKIQTLKQKMSQGVTEAKFTSQFKTKQEAVQYAKEKVQSFRDPEDGIEVWAMPDSGFNVVHTMNYSGRESVIALGGRKLGTVGPRQKGVAEGLDPYRLERLDPQTRRVLIRMGDHKEPGSWLSASEAYALTLGLQHKNRDPRGWEQEVQHFVDLYRRYSGQGVAENWKTGATLGGIAGGALGGPIGAVGGAALGGYLGHKMSSKQQPEKDKNINQGKKPTPVPSFLKNLLKFTKDFSHIIVRMNPKGQITITTKYNQNDPNQLYIASEEIKLCIQILSEEKREFREMKSEVRYDYSQEVANRISPVAFSGLGKFSGVAKGVQRAARQNSRSNHLEKLKSIDDIILLIDKLIAGCKQIRIKIKKEEISLESGKKGNLQQKQKKQKPSVTKKEQEEEIQGMSENIQPTEQTMNQSISDLVKDVLGTRPTSDWMQRWMAMSRDKKLALYQQLVSQLD